MICSGLSCVILTHYTNANYLFIDSIITWGSLYATYMTTQKILENWLYWITLDALATFCCYNKSLYLSSGLYCLYTALAIASFVIWQQKSKNARILAFEHN